jgi:hypothetical protein
MGLGQMGRMPNPFQNLNYEAEQKPKNESIFNLINDKENLNRINKIANEGVNHIVAAFYIKSVQQHKNLTRHTSEGGSQGTTLQRRASLPTSSLIENNLEQSTTQGSVPHQQTTNCELNNNNSAPNLHPQSSFQQLINNPNLPNNNLLPNKSLITNIFNDKFSNDVNEFTASQLNTVNDMMKKIKENKMTDIIEKDMTQQPLASNTFLNFKI